MNRFNLILGAFLLTASIGCSQQDVEGSTSVGGKGDDVASGEWRTRIDEDVARLRKADPTLWRQLTTVDALPTRPGFTRIRGEVVHHEVAASVFLLRYLDERDGETRAALVEALPRTGGLYEDALAELIDSEPNEDARAAMVAALGRGKTAASMHGIGKGLADKSISVRLEAAVAASRNPRGANLGPALEARLADADDSVRAAAARALGIHSIASAKESLAARLADGSAEVRLQALRALSRIDAAYLASQPQMASLGQDDDARVRRAAEKATRANR